MKKSLAVLVFVVLMQFSFVGFAFAEDGSIPEKAIVGLAIGAGLAIGLGALGGSLGQGRAAASAVEGIARNPGAKNSVQTPMIIGLALIESLVIYSLLIAFFLQGYIGKLLPAGGH